MANSGASAAVPKPTLFGCPGQAQNEGSGKEAATAKASNMVFNASDSGTLLGMGISFVENLLHPVSKYSLLARLLARKNDSC